MNGVQLKPAFTEQEKFQIRGKTLLESVELRTCLSTELQAAFRHIYSFQGNREKERENLIAATVARCQRNEIRANQNPLEALEKMAFEGFFPVFLKAVCQLYDGNDKSLVVMGNPQNGTALFVEKKEDGNVIASARVKHETYKLMDLGFLFVPQETVLHFPAESAQHQPSFLPQVQPYSQPQTQPVQSHYPHGEHAIYQHAQAPLQQPVSYPPTQAQPLSSHYPPPVQQPAYQHVHTPVQQLPSYSPPSKQAVPSHYPPSFSGQQPHQHAQAQLQQPLPYPSPPKQAMPPYYPPPMNEQQPQVPVQTPQSYSHHQVQAVPPYYPPPLNGQQPYQNAQAQFQQPQPNYPSAQYPQPYPNHPHPHSQQYVGPSLYPK